MSNPVTLSMSHISDIAKCHCFLFNLIYIYIYIYIYNLITIYTHYINLGQISGNFDLG